MSTLSLVTAVLVVAGAVILCFAIVQGRTVTGRAPRHLKVKWRVIMGLTLLFLAGYVFFVIIQIKQLPFPIEMLAGAVFFGGAVFVSMVINITRDTLWSVVATESELRKLNESLEQRVIERTREISHSQEFLRTVLDSLNDRVIIINARDLTIAGANASFLSECGLAADAVIGRTCHEVTHSRFQVCLPPDDVCPLSETVKTGKHATAEHIHYDGQANRIYVEVSTYPIRDEDGAIRQVVHVSRDITARKNTEEALRTSEDQLKMVLDSIRTGIMIVNPRNRQVVSVNRFAADALGLPKEEIAGQELGRFIRRALPGAPNIADTDDIVDNAERLLIRAEGAPLPILKSVIAVRYHGEECLVISFIDISKLKDVEEELQRMVGAMKESEERFRRLVDLSPDGIAIHLDNRYIFMNPAGMRLLGAKSPDEILGRSPFELLHPDYHDAVRRRNEQLSAGGSAPWMEQKYIRLDGADIDVEVAGVSFTHREKPAVQTIFRDISDRKLIEENLRRAALYDELTGLANRTLFFDRVRQLLQLARRNSFVVALLYIDLDRFKAVNDTLGHDMGDLLLKEVSRRLISCTRKSDTVARMGGDEFVGLCGKIEAPEDAAVVARKIIKALSQPFHLRDHVCSIGASIGISLYPGDGDDAEVLLNKADAAMYQVKESGKGSYLLYRDMGPVEAPIRADILHRPR